MMTPTTAANRLIETLIHGMSLTLDILRNYYDILTLDEQEAIRACCDALGTAGADAVCATRRRKRTRRKTRKTITPKTETPS